MDVQIILRIRCVGSVIIIVTLCFVNRFLSKGINYTHLN